MCDEAQALKLQLLHTSMKLFMCWQRRNDCSLWGDWEMKRKVDSCSISWRNSPSPHITWTADKWVWLSPPVRAALGCWTCFRFFSGRQVDEWVLYVHWTRRKDTAPEQPRRGVVIRAHSHTYTVWLGLTWNFLIFAPNKREVKVQMPNRTVTSLAVFKWP